MEMVSKLLGKITKELGSFHVPFKDILQKNIEFFSLTENVKELDMEISTFLLRITCKQNTEITMFFSRISCKRNMEFSTFFSHIKCKRT